MFALEKRVFINISKEIRSLNVLKFYVKYFKQIDMNHLHGVFILKSK